MKRIAILLAIALPLAGCQGGDDGIDHSAVEAAQAPLKNAATKAGGDWSKLTPAERQLFLDRARGNEASAKMIFGFMNKAPGPAVPKP